LSKTNEITYDVKHIFLDQDMYQDDESNILRVKKL